MAQIFDFELDQGADEDVVIAYRPGGVDFDLTGYTITAMFRKNFGEDAELTLTSAGGTPTVSIVDEVFTLHFKAAATALLLDKYYYDVKAVMGSTTRRIVEGRTTFNPATTY